MTESIYTQIRGALQVRAASAAGFPPDAQREYEGRTFKPTIGTPWARMTLIPALARPWPVNNSLILHEGVFQVDIYTPAAGGPGSNSVEVLADAVKAMFFPGYRGMQTSYGKVLIRYSERNMLLVEPDWLHIPVSIGYRAFERAT